MQEACSCTPFWPKQVSHCRMDLFTRGDNADVATSTATCAFVDDFVIALFKSAAAAAVQAMGKSQALRQ
jgi:hypothetical protein